MNKLDIPLSNYKIGVITKEEMEQEIKDLYMELVTEVFDADEQIVEMFEKKVSEL